MTSRRTFLKRVVAGGAVAGFGNYLFAGCARTSDVKIGVLAIRAGIAPRPWARPGCALRNGGLIA